MKNDNFKIMIKIVFKHFLLITTILLLVFGVFNFINQVGSDNPIGLPYYFPLELISCSLPCACCSFVYYSRKEYSKNSFLVRCTIQFILLIGIVGGEGFLFGWIESFMDFLGVFIIFLVVYIVVWIVTGIVDKKSSDMINSALNNVKEKEEKKE